MFKNVPISHKSSKPAANKSSKSKEKKVQSEVKMKTKSKSESADIDKANTHISEEKRQMTNLVKEFQNLAGDKVKNETKKYNCSKSSYKREENGNEIHSKISKKKSSSNVHTNIKSNPLFHSTTSIEGPRNTKKNYTNGIGSVSSKIERKRHLSEKLNETRKYIIKKDEANKLQNKNRLNSGSSETLSLVCGLESLLNNKTIKKKDILNSESSETLVCELENVLTNKTDKNNIRQLKPTVDYTSNPSISLNNRHMQKQHQAHNTHPSTEYNQKNKNNSKKECALQISDKETVKESPSSSSQPVDDDFGNLFNIVKQTTYENDNLYIVEAYNDYQNECVITVLDITQIDMNVDESEQSNLLTYLTDDTDLVFHRDEKENTVSLREGNQSYLHSSQQYNLLPSRTSQDQNRTILQNPLNKEEKETTVSISENNPSHLHNSQKFSPLPSRTSQDQDRTRHQNPLNNVDKHLLTYLTDDRDQVSHRNGKNNNVLLNEGNASFLHNSEECNLFLGRTSYDQDRTRLENLLNNFDENNVAKNKNEKRYENKDLNTRCLSNEKNGLFLHNYQNRTGLQNSLSNLDENNVADIKEDINKELNTRFLPDEKNGLFLHNSQEKVRLQNPSNNFNKISKADKNIYSNEDYNIRILSNEENRLSHNSEEVNLPSSSSLRTSQPDENRIIIRVPANNFDESVVKSGSTSGSDLDEPIYENIDDYRISREDEKALQNHDNATAKNQNSSHDSDSKTSDLKLTQLKKLRNVTQELISSKMHYIKNMELIIYNYKPHLELIAKKTGTAEKCKMVFGNIETIYEETQKFLVDLIKCEDDISKIGQTFMKHRMNLFALYPYYSKNKSNSEKHSKYYLHQIKEIQMEIKDRLDLRSYLLVPIQRLGKDILLLEKISKQSVDLNMDIKWLTEAIDMLKKMMRLSNDFVAIDSIKNCELSLADYCPYIFQQEFLLIKPKKLETTVFFFEGVIVFTTASWKDPKELSYWNSVKMSDLKLLDAGDEPKRIYLTDYTKSRKNSNSGLYLLEAPTESVKKKWCLEIEKRLWAQFEEYKRKLDTITKEKRNSNMAENMELKRTASLVERPISYHVRPEFFLDLRSSKNGEEVFDNSKQVDEKSRTMPSFKTKKRGRTPSFIDQTSPMDQPSFVTYLEE